MPVKDGNEAYEEIQNIRPGVKAVFMSGYNSNSAVRKSLAENKIELLLKPVTPGILLSKIREVLDR
jgi:two-component system response regulator YesN